MCEGRIDDCCKIAGEGTTSVQLFRSWAQLDMASVLTGWYGYNIFNIANFIEYEPYPKRRKLDKQNQYRATDSSNQEYELTHKVPTAIYRPYSDSTLKHKSKKSAEKHKPEVVVLDEEEEDKECVLIDGRTSIDNLFPEILCLIFEKLDLQTKGRVAQVNIYFFLRSQFIISSCRIRNLVNNIFEIPVGYLPASLEFSECFVFLVFFLYKCVLYFYYKQVVLSVIFIVLSMDRKDRLTPRLPKRLK